MEKSLVESRTFWLNLAGAVAAVAGFIPPPYGMIILAVANAVLRMYTKKPITSLLP